MYTKNNNGPKIEPCSTPCFSLVQSETVLINIKVGNLNSLISALEIRFN
jgi:hypothetical protein